MNYHIADIMVTAIARRIQDGEKVFHGVASPVPVASIMLSRELYAKELIYVNITGGTNALPEKLEISTDSDALTRRAEGRFDLTDIFDLCARGELDIAFLSGVQIDGKGNLNSSVIGEYAKPKVKLPGGAGSAVLVPSVKKAFIWRTKHDPRVFVKNVDFITTTGNVNKVFTPLCIFGKDEEGLYLEALMGNTTFEEVVENTAFEIRTKGEVIKEPLPTEEEMKALSKVDPDGIRYSEF